MVLWILNLILALLSSHSPTWPITAGQKLKYLKVKWKAFLKDFQLSQELFQQNWSDLIKFYSAQNHQKNDDRNHQKMMISRGMKVK